jgi:lysosomal acid lipase/cholesteryl ester hydrolase
VNAPTYLYWGDNDWLGDPTDIRDHILPGLPSQYLVNSSMLTEFSHIDFIWGERAANEVYQPMINAIKQDMRENYKDNKCF